MVKCAACGKFLAANVSACCSGCPQLYHRACVAVPEGTTISRDWKCPDCKRRVRKGDNSSTPVRGMGNGSQDGSNSANQKVSEHSSGAVVHGDAELPPCDVKDFRRELAEYMAELREFRKEMAEARAERAATRERVIELERRLETVEKYQRDSGPGKQAELERTVAGLKAELNDRDQDALLSDIDIGHLPEEKGENIVHTVCVLATRLGVALQEQDVVFAERVGAPPGEGGRARRVVLRLARRQLRDDMLRAAPVRRVPVPGVAHVYVNERLTRYNSHLFHRVREECRKQGWKYSWTRRGRVYTRKGDGQPAFSIRSDSDLVRVFGLPQDGPEASDELQEA